ncbi:MAG TPA: family 10 glycosylhydrolase [Phycisphaerae bacterium]|nr:family 10 glycosylhydrolase [Phycisphaerae bacterium]
MARNRRHLHQAALRLAGATFALFLFGSTAMAQEFRAFWVDAWGNGFKSQSQVDALLGVPGNPNSRGTIRDANCNAVIVQVRRRADVCYPSAMGEPYFSGLTPSNFNALQAIINAAHDTTGGKQRVEVHCWVVAFATDGGSVYHQHKNPSDLNNYWVTLDNYGNETSDKALDPGHPRCLQYLTDVCMDLVTNFDIDGLHYDYIRFTANNQGYNPVSVARYNARYGLTGQPNPTDEQFKQWRRDQVTAFVRKVYANVQAVKPWVKVSASVVTWNPSPTASTRQAFMNTRAYYDVYSDWDAWMQEGILDMSMPMTYYNQASLPNDYQRWMNFQKDRKFNRHNIVGPGIYLNSLSNAILQLQKTREASPSGNYAQGFSGYSYRVPYSGGSWASFAPSLVSQVTPTPTTIPEMPWKTAPTKGHMMGTVTYVSNGEWADGATATITGPENRTQICDGTGFYAFIDLTPGTYTLTISKKDYVSSSANVTVTAGKMAQRNMQLATLVLPPQIQNVRVFPGIFNATISWDTTSSADSVVRYGPGSYAYTASDPNQLTTHTIVLENLRPDTVYNYQVVSTNAAGSAETAGATFRTMAFGTEIVVDNTDPGWANTSPGGGAWTSAAYAGVPRIGDTYLYASGVNSYNETSATRKCTWTPYLPQAGHYDVYAFYQRGSNRASSAPYKVFYSGGSVTSIQNQNSSTSDGGWFLIGENLPFEAGSTGYVQLSNNIGSSSQLVSADAVKFVPRPDTTPPSTPVVIDEGVQTSHRTSLSVTCVSTDPESGIQRFEYRILRQGHGVIRDWTEVDSQPQIHATDLALPIGTYIFEVRATNYAGLTSDVGSSDGITVFPFDADQNGRVDETEVTLFRLCRSGEGQPYSAEEALQCNLFDVDMDGDVDQADFGAFQRCITGQLMAIDLKCVED